MVFTFQVEYDNFIQNTIIMAVIEAMNADNCYNCTYIEQNNTYSYIVFFSIFEK